MPAVASAETAGSSHIRREEKFDSARLTCSGRQTRLLGASDSASLFTDLEDAAEFERTCPRESPIMHRQRILHRSIYWSFSVCVVLTSALDGQEPEFDPLQEVCEAMRAVTIKIPSDDPENWDHFYNR